jgi:hypothetical protein
MSETPINLPNETSSRRIEIINYPHSDVIINNDAGHAAYGRRLAELFKDGYPSDWQPIGDKDTDMIHGVVDGTDFVVKPKTRSGIDMYDQQKQVRTAFAKNERERRAILRSTQLLNSALSEIGLAPVTKGVIAGQSAQDMANSWGFKSFSLVEPVIGVIYKPSGFKSLVYEYIDSAKTLDDESVKSKYGISFEKSEEMMASLEQLFKSQGIQADDLSERQLMTDSKDNLYLIDTELYQRLPPGH